MKLFLVTFLIIFGLLNVHNSLNAQPNISISITNTNVNNVDSAKSVFGLNEIRYTILNKSAIQVKVRSKGSEFKIGNGNWVTMPVIDVTSSHGGNKILPFYGSVNGLRYVPIFNLYWDETFNMQSFAISGGIIDYRLVFGVYHGNTNTDTTFYSPVIHIVVPAATSEDASALQYVIQQKTTCPEMEYFFANFNASSLECDYAYEYLSANFPGTALGKVAKYKMAVRECLLRRSQINTLPEVKASIINTKNMLLSSDIPYVKQLAKNLTCANN